MLVGRLLGFSILSRGWIGIGILVCALAGLSWFYSRWRRIDDGSLAETLEELSILAAYAPVVASLSYVLAAVAMPLVDPQLAELDRLVGLDWPAWYRLVSSFPTLESALALLYRSSLVHIVLLLLALGLLGRRDRARELNMLLITTSFPMVVLSGFLPAQSAWIQYDMGLEKAYHLSQFESLRSGTLRVLEPGTLLGIVTFPSFHTAIALTLVWVTRGIAWLFWPTLVVNLGVLVSIPSEGGHYFIDAFAGALLTGAAISAAARRARLNRAVAYTPPAPTRP